MPIDRRMLPLALMAVLPWLALGPASAAEPADAFALNKLLARGVNFGNALEAPNEGDWGMTLEADYFEQIRRAGFSAVRIPICWSAHAGARAPYTIDETFFQRVDWAIDQALSRKLAAVINVQHYDDLCTDPDDHWDRFLGIWEQIARRYRDRSDGLFFELLNEPHGKLDAPTWNRLAREGLAAVRKTNPLRVVIVGPIEWNAIAKLESLELPADDRRLIATVHYYLPFEFTHQGVPWMPEAANWLGTKWTGDDAERQAIERDFDTAAAWSKKHRRPIYLGEFGAYSRAEMESRARWTGFVRAAAEKRGFSWAYWEFGSDFGVYDRSQNIWRQPLLEALLPRK